jgi:hypothetical protein
MAKGPGRNAPCPCGSGRKYKNCCLPADEERARLGRATGLATPTVSTWDVPEDDLDEDDPDDFAGSPLVGPPPDAATVAAQNALWEGFEGAEYAAQIAQFQEALKGDALDADLAFEMLAEIQAEAQARGKLAAFDTLLQQFAREAPGFYQADGAYYAGWAVENALASGNLSRLPAALEPFAQDPAAGLEELFRVADQLQYYDQMAPLLDTLQRGWVPMNEATLLPEDAIEAYTDLLVDVTTYEYARTAAEPRADDPTLARQLATYFPPEGVAFYQQNAAALLGTLGRAWHARDFESPPRTEPRERRLGLLAWEWAGVLWREQAVPLGRATLAAQALLDYQVEGAAKGKSAQTMLVPARRRLDRFLKDQCEVLDYREYRAGAVVELLALYPAFLAARGLLDSGAAARALAELYPLVGEFLRKLDADRDDPAIAGAIRARWDGV